MVSAFQYSGWDFASERGSQRGLHFRGLASYDVDKMISSHPS